MTTILIILASLYLLAQPAVWKAALILGSIFIAGLGLLIVLPPTA